MGSSIVVLPSPKVKPLFMEIFKRTNDYIKTKEILLTQYNIQIRIEKSGGIMSMPYTKM